MDRRRTKWKWQRVMAVDTPAAQISPPGIRDYWPNYYKKAVRLVVVAQILSTAVVAGGLLIVGLEVASVSFWAILLVCLGIFSGINLILLNHLLVPLKDLTSALTHISGEPTIITPPNPNDEHFEHSGFKPLLQLIYTLASGGEKTDLGSSKKTIDLYSALDHSAAGVIMLDGAKQVIYANTQAPIHTDSDGLATIDLIFQDSPTLNDWLQECDETAVHAEHTWRRVANKITGEEDRKIYDLVASYQKGSETEVILTLFDRTVDYKPEDDELDFIAFAAHELRGPITVIRGYLDVLKDELADTLKDDQVELLNRLVVSSNRLSSYINNILNASSYDRRHLKVHLNEDSLAGIYDTISDDMQLRASSQNRLLAVDLPDTLPSVAADRASISEVIGNLIDNAIKYSNEGGAVSVTAAIDGEFVKVSVADNGIGMPGNVIGNLFHKFYRSHRSRETVAGTGIGLYICKAIVESHGGAISVSSTVGQGSVFTFNLPIYSTVAEKLKANDNSSESMISRGGGWIKNHAMYRG